MAVTPEFQQHPGFHWCATSTAGWPAGKARGPFAWAVYWRANAAGVSRVSRGFEESQAIAEQIASDRSYRLSY